MHKINAWSSSQRFLAGFFGAASGTFLNAFEGLDPPESVQVGVPGGGRQNLGAHERLATACNGDGC